MPLPVRFHTRPFTATTRSVDISCRLCVQSSLQPAWFRLFLLRVPPSLRCVRAPQSRYLAPTPSRQPHASHLAFNTPSLSIDCHAFQRRYLVSRAILDFDRSYLDEMPGEPEVTCACASRNSARTAHFSKTKAYHRTLRAAHLDTWIELPFGSVDECVPGSDTAPARRRLLRSCSSHNTA